MTAATATWLVNRSIPQHTGPFTTRDDACLAFMALGRGWEVMTKAEFDAWLDAQVDDHRSNNV